MEPLTWGFIGTLIGAIVGASASIFTTYINARNSSKIQENIEALKEKKYFEDFKGIII